MILPFNTHTKLNPVLWSDDNIVPEVQVALLRIAKEYWKFLNINTPIIDILVSGSQANYNYNTDSDLDLHIIVDYSAVSCDDSSVEDLFYAKRDLWRDEHNIDIHDIPVEVFVEDVATPAKSATYSILKNEWINHPIKLPPVPDHDKSEVIRITNAWLVLINEKMNSKDIQEIIWIKELLWDYRRTGLAKHGEMGIPNLVFKTLRSNGVSDMLIKTIRKLRDDDLSLEQQKED